MTKNKRKKATNPENNYVFHIKVKKTMAGLFLAAVKKHGGGCNGNAKIRYMIEEYTKNNQ